MGTAQADGADLRAAQGKGEAIGTAINQTISSESDLTIICTGILDKGQHIYFGGLGK